MEVRKTTIAQKIAEAFQMDKPKMDTLIPLEYQRHVEVFLEQEAEQFPPSRAWDHHIPLKADASNTINEKIYNLSKAGKQAIKEWVYKMLKRGSSNNQIHDMDMQPSLSQRKMGHSGSSRTIGQLTSILKRIQHCYQTFKMWLKA